MEFLTSILTITIRAGTSLTVATIGEILTERSGVLNLGVEGIMLMGALPHLSLSFTPTASCLDFWWQLALGDSSRSCTPF
jgi:ABC-type uncharacterized transport system permease subunit